MERAAEKSLQNQSKIAAQLISDGVIRRELNVLYELASRPEIKTMDWEAQRHSLLPDIGRLGYLDFGIVGMDGTAHYIGDESTSYLGDRDYIKKALAGEVVVSDVLISRVINEPVVMFAAPILVNGRVAGALIGRRDGAVLTNMTGYIGLGNTGYVYMINPQGTVICHPNTELVYDQFNPVQEVRNDPSLRSLAAFFEDILNDNGMVSEYVFNGKTMMGAYAKVPNSDWFLIGTIERDEFFFEINGMFISNLVIAGAAALAAAFILIGILRFSLIKPLKGIVSAATSLANMEFDIDIPGERGDETGAVQKAFLAIRDNLKKTIADISEAKLKAETANEAKSTFLAKTSHEIRTPMNAIVGMSELILREKISPKVYEYTMGIKQAGANLLSIINDILDFSKIESGKLEILPVRYYFRSFINDVINIIRIRALEKSLVFITNIDSALPNDLMGDEVRIRQILLNLLGNAVKYTDRDFIKLFVTAEEGEDSAEKGFVLKIEIEDCGIGIKEEDLETVFGEFIQVDMAANRGIEGSGLGLAITRRLCRAMGGDVTVRSTYGKGSVFTVRVPQKTNSAERFAGIENPGEQRVLIYENRKTTVDSLCWSLDNLGVSYTLAAGEDAFLETLRWEEQEGGEKYTFIFMAQALYVHLRPVLKDVKFLSRLVLLADYGSESGFRSIRFLILPVHTLSIANIINHKTEQRSDAERGRPAVQFTAPSARVLIVDDIVTNLKVVQGLLLPYNMIMDTCLTGAASIEFFKKYKYDMVLMDHMMPGMDGIEATAAIRAWEKENAAEFPAEIPVIALTANAISGMREMFLQRGFNDYLTKPIEMFKLHEVLKKWIPREKQIREKPGFEDDSDIPIDSSVFEGKNIDGIDLAAGMERYKSGSIYLEILRSYAASIPDFLNTLRDVSRETLDSYIVTVHGIKGSSYQICAEEAGREAELLETAARARDWKTIEERNGDFIGTIERLFESLDRFLAETEGPPLYEKPEDRRTVMTGQDRKKIILAVDDMPLNLTAIRTILRDDFDIRLAKSPVAALGMLNTVKVDLILADVEMPEMSGFEFVDRLRNNAEQKDIPVIFVTSHEAPDVIERVVSYGAGYVVKPVIPRILLEKVKAAFETGGTDNFALP
jgi:signal transduction histidine kinase/CheY-like chemotaxis protein